VTEKAKKVTKKRLKNRRKEKAAAYGFPDWLRQSRQTRSRNLRRLHANKKGRDREGCRGAKWGGKGKTKDLMQP